METSYKGHAFTSSLDWKLTGKEGGGLQIANSPNARGLTQFGFSDVGPAFRLISSTTWDYDHADMKELNQKIYGNDLAENLIDITRRVSKDWFPDYSKNGWKMGFFAGQQWCQLESDW